MHLVFIFISLHNMWIRSILAQQTARLHAKQKTAPAGIEPTFAL